MLTMSAVMSTATSSDGNENEDGDVDNNAWCVVDDNDDSYHDDKYYEHSRMDNFIDIRYISLIWCYQ